MASIKRIAFAIMLSLISLKAYADWVPIFQLNDGNELYI
jgi:hypothetical protein